MARKVESLLIDTTGLVPVVIWDLEGKAALFEYFDPDVANQIKRKFDFIREDEDGTLHLREKHDQETESQEGGNLQDF